MSKIDKYTIENLLNKIQTDIKMLINSLEHVSLIGFVDSQINLKEWSKKNVDYIKAYYSDIKEQKPEEITNINNVQKLEILNQNIIDNLSINILRYYFNCRAFKKILELTGKSDIKIIKEEDSNYFLETEEIYEPEFVEEEIGELSEEEELELDEMLETETEEIKLIHDSEVLTEEESETFNKLLGVEELPKEEIEVVEHKMATEEIDTETFEPYLDTEENQELYRQETGGNPIRMRKPTKKYLKWLEEKK